MTSIVASTTTRPRSFGCLWLCLHHLLILVVEVVCCLLAGSLTQSMKCKGYEAVLLLLFSTAVSSNGSGGSSGGSTKQCCCCCSSSCLPSTILANRDTKCCCYSKTTTCTVRRGWSTKYAVQCLSVIVLPAWSCWVFCFFLSPLCSSSQKKYRHTNV